MIITLLCYLPSVVVLMLIGLIIILKNANNRVYLSFFSVVMLIALWQLALCISYIHANYGVSLWALRVAVGVGTFIAPALFYFATYFPTRLGKTSRLVQLLI